MVGELTLFLLVGSLLQRVTGDICVEAGTSRRIDSCLNTSPYTPLCNSVPNLNDLPENAKVVPLWWSCNCDPKCLHFGDCCYDYRDVCQRGNDTHPYNNGTYTEEGSDAKVHMCTSVTNRSGKGFWMIRKCANSWKDDVIREKCETIGPFDVSLRRIPVTWPAGRDVFANIYCAECNGIGQSEVFMWNVSVKSAMNNPSTVIEEPSASKNPMAMFLNLTQKTDSLATSMDDKTSSFLRPCVYDIIDTCQSSLYDNESEFQRMEQLCRADFSMVSETELLTGLIVTYRNAHCAVCNGQNLDRIPFRCGINLVGFDIGYRERFTLSFLFDMNSSGYISLSIRSTTPGGPETDLSHDFRCENGEVFDPKIQTCSM
ncbi:uncharacterized protein [Ptychodera flava]|uniref:uncharacterized protein n=1 Tax=Ptychodera flava TaxID=63121 RepID=UPI00396A9510